MAKLSEGCFGDIKFDYCPPNVSLPDDLYKFSTGVTTDGATLSATVDGFSRLHGVSYKPSKRQGLNTFKWSDGELYISQEVSEKVIRMVFFNTFAPPAINAHSYQFFQIEPGDVVIDGGAFEGFYTFDCFNRGASRVFAFEPLPIMVEALRKNFGNKDKLKIYQAVGSLDAKNTLHLNKEGSAVHGRMEGHGKQLDINIRTVDSVVAENGNPAIDIIKLDIEGSEFDCLIGAMNTIKRCKPKLIVETYHRYMDAFLIYRYLTSIRPDYHIVLWGRWTGSLVKDEAYRPCKPYTLVAW